MSAQTCIWTLDAVEADWGEDVWATACGRRFQVTEGTPAENDMRFCCYCGGALTEVRPAPAVDVDE